MDKFNRKTRNRDELTRRGNNVSQLSDHVIHKRNKQLKIIKPVDNDTKHLINPYVNMFFKGSSGSYTNSMDMMYADVIHHKKHKVSSLIYNLVYHKGKDAVYICDKFPELINVKSRVEGYGNIHPLNAAITALKWFNNKLYEIHIDILRKETISTNLFIEKQRKLLFFIITRKKHNLSDRCSNILSLP